MLDAGHSLQNFVHGDIQSRSLEWCSVLRLLDGKFERRHRYFAIDLLTIQGAGPRNTSPARGNYDLGEPSSTLHKFVH